MDSPIAEARLSCTDRSVPLPANDCSPGSFGQMPIEIFSGIPPGGLRKIWVVMEWFHGRCYAVCACATVKDRWRPRQQPCKFTSAD